MTLKGLMQLENDIRKIARQGSLTYSLDNITVILIMELLKEYGIVINDERCKSNGVNYIKDRIESLICIIEDIKQGIKWEEYDYNSLY